METTPTTDHNSAKSKPNGTTENGCQNGDDQGSDHVGRKSRISLRESRVTQKPDTDKMRQELNDLRERLSSGVALRERSDEVDEIETKEEAEIGDLHVVFISDSEISYTNKAFGRPPDEVAGSVKVTVGYKTFEIHKSILLGSCGYFRTKFAVDQEMTGVDLGTIVGVNGFTLILDFLYDGTGIMNPRVGEIIFDTAAILEIDWIMAAAVDYLQRQIQPSNYRAVHDLFEKHKMDGECNRVIRTVSQYLVEFSDDRNFLRTLQYDLLKKILSDNYFVDGSEGFVVKIILDWVHVDVSRDERLPFLMKLVRFPLLEPEELLSLPEIVKKITGLEKEIDDAMEYACNICAQYKYTGEKYLGRGHRDVMALLSATECNNGAVVMYKDLSRMEESMCLENIHPRGLQTMLVYTSQATLGNFVYAAGGLDDDYSITGRMFRYDPRIRDWHELATMTSSRMLFAMVSSDRNLFAIGGESQSDDGRETILNTAEIYDPDENRWTPLIPLPLSMAECAGAYYDGNLYVCGGVESKGQGSRVFQHCYVCDVANNGRWVKLDDLPIPRMGHSMSVVGANIYALGGRTPGESGAMVDCLDVHVYDVTARSWSASEPLHRGVRGVDKHVAVVGESLAFMADSRWRLYNTQTGDTILGEYSGTDVQRVAYLKVAYPPTEGI